jgi:hypothetical protein
MDDSAWSRAFSLDSVGVPQELNIEVEAKGDLEVGFKIDFAPGRFGKYTKVVRFSPRFVFVNRLPYNIRICQPTAVVGEFNESVTVQAAHRKAFHLPSVFGKRKVAVQIEGGFARTVLFHIDMTGEFRLLIKREINLATIPHIVTRPARFTVYFPATDLGIWFETDWKQKEIVVKVNRMHVLLIFCRPNMTSWPCSRFDMDCGRTIIQKSRRAMYSYQWTPTPPRVTALRA